MKGTILVTQNGGATWEAQRSRTDQNLFGVYFVNAQTGWVVGAAGTILATLNGGASWEIQRSGTESQLLGVYFADAKTGWAVGWYGTIRATHNGGLSWETQHSGTLFPVDLFGVHFVDVNTGWVVGQGIILATRNGGADWEEQQSGGDLSKVYFADAQTGWAVGPGGTILATRSGGTNWQVQPTNASQDIESVYFADAQTGWAVGHEGTMLRAGHFFMSPLVETPDAVTTQGGVVDLSFRIAHNGFAPIRSILIEARVGEAEWSRVGKPTTSPGPDKRLHTFWKPAALGIAKGRSIEYRMVIDDGGPSLPPISIGAFVFAPPSFWEALVSYWHELVAAVLFLYAFTFVVLLLLTRRYAAAFRLVSDSVWAKFLTWPFFFLRHLAVVQRWVLEPWFQEFRRATRTGVEFLDPPISSDTDSPNRIRS
jgi:hypothetical protein